MSATKFLRCSCRQCGGHIEYPAEAAGMTLACPHCQTPTELTVEVAEVTGAQPRRSWLVWTAFVVLVVIVGMTVWVTVMLKRIDRRKTARNKTITTTAVKTNVAAANPVSVLNNFEVGEVRVLREGSLNYAVGSLRNTLAKQRFSVRAEVELLDETSRVVGTASDYAPVIEPNAEWRFRAMILKGSPASARVTRIREQQ